MYEVIWDKKAYEQLEKLDFMIARRIVKKVQELTENPLSKDIKRLKGLNYFRMRVGDYRIIFEINENKIIILKVAHRKNVYDF
jgi:mRNA interferase RelE/StbE